MPLSYIGAGGRVSWRDVLAFVAVKGDVSASAVAKNFNLKHSDACHRLRRLKDWGMVRADGGARDRLFSATDYGMKVAQNPFEKDVKEDGTAGIDEDLYPEFGDASGLIEGPVSLMRLVEVRYEDFQSKGLSALPSRLKLTGDMLSVEKKYDGWLAQSAHARIYSRRGKELTQNFLPIARDLADFRADHLVGELVYWNHSIGKMHEPAVTSIAGTDDPDEAARKMKELEKTGFFQIVVFDLIAHEGRDVSKNPFEERRKILEDLIESEDDRRVRITRSSIHALDEWQRVFQAALVIGGEGVVLKNLRAPYLWNPLGQREPRPSGVQWKIKAVRSDDFVVFAWKKSEKDKVTVRFGQFCRGELIEVGEVNNLSREREREVVALLERGPFVAEIEFQERFPRYPGRLRNPVFRRMRPEKPIESATMPPEYC